MRLADSQSRARARGSIGRTPLVADPDRRVAGAVSLHQRIERRRVGGMQPDAAMRGRAPEMLDLVGAVDGVAAHKED
jgi:hypothetical protein